ncbi:MAG: hypothetical protein AB7P76_01670 [Candidatus Melainabacteria bacterium]
MTPMTRSATTHLPLAGLVLGGLLLGFGGPAPAQELQSDPAVQTELSRQPAGPAAATPQPAPDVVLHGGVTTLESAIQTETAIDWYAWYMAARRYLMATGGISCPVGTPIRFYKNGRLDADSHDGVCLYSLKNKRFPLPENTALDAVILPTRSAIAPPANPGELNDYVNRSGR